jgi:acetylglutamate kinase
MNGWVCRAEKEGAMERYVLKVGGNELDDAEFVSGLVEALRRLWQTRAVALVHGGGKAIARLQERLSLQPQFVEGLRVTDDESLDVAEMVLSGWINKRLVARLVSEQIPALGLSGVDNGLFRVVKMRHDTHDLGWVGDIVETEPSDVEALLSRGVTPVVSPISLGMDGHTYNVNADHAATALACAVAAQELVFLSNVPGVLVGREGEAVRLDGECVPVLTPREVESLIASGEIRGGMVPKVRSALAALERGVSRVRITDLAGLVVDGGTCFLTDDVGR